ncbi:hypothetical protein FH972_021256 [Carpinus fangiana]|uniref:Uncharacterized protein n=1 Tax=Carpinus fangiana TaxID=176857 RepID=A0A5N6KNW1_9ROSI|nr:hypothetical protein FH972_021256 [Carpinus fangiana]
MEALRPISHQNRPSATPRIRASVRICDAPNSRPAVEKTPYDTFTTAPHPTMAPKEVKPRSGLALGINKGHVRLPPLLYVRLSHPRPPHFENTLSTTDIRPRKRSLRFNPLSASAAPRAASASVPHLSVILSRRLLGTSSISHFHILENTTQSMLLLAGYTWMVLRRMGRFESQHAIGFSRDIAHETFPNPSKSDRIYLSYICTPYCSPQTTTSHFSHSQLFLHFTNPKKRIPLLTRTPTASPPTSAASSNCYATPKTSAPASSPRSGSAPSAARRERSTR